MKQYASRYILSTALVAFLLSVTISSAGTTVTVAEDQVVTIGLKSVIEFNIYLDYEGFGPLTFYAERTLNDLPDQKWFSTICMDDYCYRDTENKTEPVSVESSGRYHVKFAVYTSDIEATGNFQLKLIASGPGSEELGVIDFTVTSSDESSVEVIEDILLTPYPVPATTRLTIPTTSPVSGSTTLEVFDASGNAVAEIDRASMIVTDGGIGLDVANLPEGAYFFRLRDDDVLRTGRFLVSR